jgi:signal transduction histidine kinase
MTRAVRVMGDRGILRRSEMGGSGPDASQPVAERPGRRLTRAAPLGVAREMPGVVSSLLVAAQELLSTFGSSKDPLRQACRITRDVLDADIAVAFGTSDGGLTLRSETQYGLSDETWASYQVVQLPDEIASRICDRLAHTDVSMIDVAAPGESPDDLARREIARKIGFGPILLLALRAGGVLTGVMVACRYAHRESFDPVAVRVATGFGPLLGASLENQRLLQRLEAAHQAQTEFLASMSHELRTPLNVITGYLDMLLDGLAGPLAPAQREICERIRRSAGQQLSLVGEAFEISRRDADGRIPVRREEIALAALVAELEREAALRPVAPEVAVSWTVHDVDLPVVSDPVKLRMIVRNLVDNAIKFTERGHVRVEVSLDDDVLLWRVEDTGVGIPEAECDAIFEAFRQVGGRSTGLGLGLHIVRRLTDALGGTVEVASTVGVGSTFTVRLPVDVVEPAREKQPLA